ncbi:AsmA-like C-terminal region-containing protein [Rhodoblastus sp.]|uniref:AsmA family protein n=1 Tax=Rhodoblastus sp. TaxID=1962975 RepID=UPI0035B1D464
MTFNIRWILAAVIAAVVALAAAPWTVSQSAQIEAIERAIKSASNVRLVSHGRSVFAMLPRPHIRIYDVNLDFDEGAATVAASSLRVDLGLSGIFTGRLDLARVILADAVITLDAARSRIDAPLAAAPGRWPKPPGEVELTNSKALLRHAAAEKPELIADACDARLDFSRASAPVSLIGHCVLPLLGDDRSPTRFALWAAKPDALPRGEESSVNLRVEGEAVQITLNGAVALSPKPRFHGRVAGAAPSLRQVTQWFGLTLPLPGHYRDVSFKGDATLEPNLLSLAPIAVTVDGNALDGVASVRLDGQRPLIAATLAGSEVNLGPMFEDVPAPISGGQWNRDEFLASRLGATDLDLRLSASHARLGDFQAENVAVSAILKNGRLDLALAEASAYSGHAHARAIIAEGPDGLDVRGSASAEKIDVAALLWDIFRRQSLSGTGRVNASFETHGDSFYDLAGRLDARGNFAVESGEIYGIDLGLAFRRLERQPLSAGVELRSGRTAFDQLSGKFNIVQGQAEVDDGLARDERAEVAFSARAQIAERTVDLHAVATRAATTPDAKPLQIGFSLTGGWDDASLAPDALGLIRRSNAAAPLLPKDSPQN